jgi:hypothetical protein
MLRHFIRLIFLCLFFSMAGYMVAPQLITKLCSPWIMENDERLSFVCRSVSPWSLDLVDVQFDGRSANVHVDEISIGFDPEKLMNESIVDAINIQNIRVEENHVNSEQKKSSKSLHSNHPSFTSFEPSNATASSDPPKSWQQEILDLEIPVIIKFLSISQMEVIPIEKPSFIIEDVAGSCTTSGANLGAQVQSLGGLGINTQFSWSGERLKVVAKVSPSVWGQRSNALSVIEVDFKLSSVDVSYQASATFLSLSGSNEAELVLRGEGDLSSHRWELLSLNPEVKAPHLKVSWSKEQSQNIILEQASQPMGQIGWDDESIWFQPDEQNNEAEGVTEFLSRRFTFHHKDSAFSTAGSIAEMSEEGIWKSSSLDYSVPLTPGAGNGWLKGSLEVVGLDTLDLDFTLFAQADGYTIAGNVRWQTLALPEIPLLVEFHPPLNYHSLLRNPSQKPWFGAYVKLPSHELSIFTDEFGLPAGHLSVQVEGDVEVSFSPNTGLVERAQFNWKDGFYSSEDMGTMLDGLSGKIDSSSLSSFKTGSAQEIRWKKINTEGFTLDEGELFWQWEEEQRLFVESMRAGWCGGVLNLQSFRVEFPLNNLKLVLFCEGIELDQLLKQFQVGDVEGDGDLGGRLSLELNGDKISFDDAYLYTAPAREGSLKILEAQGLDQAMEQNQLKLVRECLKDYRYRWAKISFDAEDEDLVLRLQMDGRPAGLLPFRFDTKTAEFVYDLDAPGVDLKGLKLNTNFRSAQLWPLILSSLKWAQQVEMGNE